MKVTEGSITQGIGTAVATALLFLFIATLGYMFIVTVKAGLDMVPVSFHSGIIYVFKTVGGLVTALVVATLSITKPGEPVPRNKISFLSVGRFSTYLPYFFVIVWLLFGIAAVIIGVLLFPETSETVNDYGISWLGLAVASGYAFFGIDPTK